MPPTAAPPALMTTEELLAMPENGSERWLVAGQLREKPRTVRNRWHSRVMARIAQLLGDWLDRQPAPRGEVLDGEVGVRLRRNPDTTVGIDVVYIGPELAAEEPDDTRLVDGIPVLAVEILSPSDTEEDTNEKVALHREVGVPLVWLVDPNDRTVVVYRLGLEPELFNVHGELSGDPELPGLRIPVARIFTR